ncbi:cupredoxin domain-containing protein [Paenibacillus sp. N1-5-1-14]|uniref:cupredoxin domain-containing protein n=1 Tax=Paenibacillus radicibacter TaxID=2972488 RepID=UPI002158C0CE|nr:cupredoxin domain-containing protein [Paenibacillus radicibacter]MCR8642363.1 cupredoxin domain-containing protein [Paenibacillus radicibacter]
MYKWLMSILLVVAIVMGGSVLYSTISERVTAAEAEKKDAGSTLKIVASNFQFDQAEYKVKKGDKLKIVFSNKEGVHAMEIKDLNVKLDKATASQEVTFDKVGEFEIHCALLCGTGHDKMISKLVVTE